MNSRSCRFSLLLNLSKFDEISQIIVLKKLVLQLSSQTGTEDTEMKFGTRLIRTMKKRQVATALLALILGVAPTMRPAFADSDKHLTAPQRQPARAKYLPKTEFTPDVLLVMPDAKADSDELSDALKEAHGKVIATLGEGKLKLFVVKTEKGQLDAAEKKLLKDRKHFSAVGRNYKIAAERTPHDPDFHDQWFLPAVNAPRAWDKTTGGATIAVFDTGVQASNPDLAGRVLKGYDAHTVASQILGGIGGVFGDIPGVSDLAGAIAGAASSGAQTDKHGHGTEVATTAFAALNDTLGAGIAPSCKIYPVRIADGNPGSAAMTTDLDLIAAMMNVKASGIRVINISYGAPYVGFTNALLHAPLHQYFIDYYYLHSGMIFMSAGNDGVFDTTLPVPYLNVVSAVDSNGQLSTDYKATSIGPGGSSYGPAVRFTAPGSGIVCSGIDNKKATVWGTSFSSPIVAAEAALIISRNPALPNVAVENILRASCVNIQGSPFNMYYGWGMPDAARAVKLAGGGF
jgi:thermitase